MSTLYVDIYNINWNHVSYCSVRYALWILHGNALVSEAGSLRFESRAGLIGTCQLFVTAATFLVARAQWRGDGPRKLVTHFVVIQQVYWKRRILRCNMHWQSLTIECFAGTYCCIMPWVSGKECKIPGVLSRVVWAAWLMRSPDLPLIKVHTCSPPRCVVTCESSNLILWKIVCSEFLSTLAVILCNHNT